MALTKLFNDIALNATSQTTLVEFSAVPDAGAFTLEVNGEETASIPFDADAADVLQALRDLDVLEDTQVEVTGDFTAGFEIIIYEFPAPNTIAEGANTLENTSTPVTITIDIERSYIIDIGSYKEMALSVTYPANGGSLELSLSGGTTDDPALMAVIESSVVTLDALGGTHLYNIGEVFFKWLKINVPDLDSVSARFQGIKFGL